MAAMALPVALAAVGAPAQAAPAQATPTVPLVAGTVYTGEVAFPRPQRMTLQVTDAAAGRLRANMAFDGRCRGGRLSEVWAFDLPAREGVRLNGDAFSARLTTSHRGVAGRRTVGRFTWRLTGRFTDARTVTARVSGSLAVHRAGKVIARCTIARPASVRLSVRGG
jgi:hypothetical protein